MQERGFFPFRRCISARLSCKSLETGAGVAEGTGSMFDYAGALSGCARGDRDALKRLYDEEAGRMISVAQRIVRRRELAEEVVQDAFVQIWRKADTYKSELGAARGWIYTIVRNRALNLIRDGAREDLVEAETLDRVRDEAVEIQ